MSAVTKRPSPKDKKLLDEDEDQVVTPIPQAKAKMSATSWDMRKVSLAVLTVQNAALGICMRKARTTEGPMFVNSTAVLMGEVVKFFICLLLVFKDEGSSVPRWLDSLHRTFVQDFRDTIVVCVPSAVYFVQNVLLYVAASNLDVATYQITYQMKILTTALFAMSILGRSFSRQRWLALLILVGGVATVQLSGVRESKVSTQDQSRLLGFVSATVATVCSGFAGVFFEKILKGSEVSVWMRNVQLSILSIPSGIAFVMFKDGQTVMEQGFFYGYSPFVWFVVVLNATGGLLVALVIKHADNILKGYACSLAILLSGVVSYFFFGLEMSLQFLVGASMVMGSVYLYNADSGGGGGAAKPPASQEPSKGMQKV